MAKFVFKLKSLLNIKKQMEDSLKNELGKAIQRLENEKLVLRQIENEKLDCINEINSKSSKGLKVDKLREYSAYISHLRDRIELQKVNINQAQFSVDNYREQLIKVSQEKQMLEKLKEKKYQDYLNEQFQHEQRVNDEIVSYKYNNNLTGDTNG